MTKSSETRMSRWSRLKIKQKTGNDKYQALASSPDDNDGEHAGSTLSIQSMTSLVDQDQATDITEVSKTDAEQLAQEPDLDSISDELELPKIDDLTEKSDFTLFMGDKVPEALKKAAMRKLWLSNPIFANLDGLNDYDEDYNVIDKLISALDTDYQVGRGFLDPDEDEAETPEIETPDATASDTATPEISESIDDISETDIDEPEDTKSIVIESKNDTENASPPAEIKKI